VKIVPALQEKVTLRRLNLMEEEYGLQSAFEIIFCRNVIIYFDKPTQVALLRRLLRHLVPGGFLFLGHSESLNGIPLPCETVGTTIYRKTQGAA
jgi:chemotaxis protein methyltransferase CheR